MDKQFSVDGVICRITQWGRIKTMPGKSYLTNFTDPDTGEIKVRISDKVHDVGELILTYHGDRKRKSREVRAFKDGDPTNLHIRNLEWVEERPVKKVAMNELTMEHKKFIHDLKKEGMRSKDICEKVLKEFFLDLKPQMVSPAAKGYKTHVTNMKRKETMELKKQAKAEQQSKETKGKDSLADIVEEKQQEQKAEEQVVDEKQEADNPFEEENTNF